MTLEPEYVEFRPHDRAVVVARMAELARDRSGWVNLQPGVPEETATARPGLVGLLTGRSNVPLATWVPGEVGRRGVEPTSVGIQHAAGGRVAPRLAEAGLPVPDGWRVVQDNPRRGLVALLPDDADLDAVVDWLVRATEAVATVDLTGEWRAAFYSR